MKKTTTPSKREQRTDAQDTPTRRVRARFFPTSPQVSQQIEDWKARTGKRVIAVLPVYTEDSRHE